MVKHILVASDLTSASAPAMRTAIDLARRLDATVTVLHVVAPPYDEGGLFTTLTAGDRAYLRSLCEREQHAAAQVLREQVQGCVEGRDPVPVTPRVQLGTPADGIIAAAEAVGADVIVLGTHGRTGWQHVVLGSVAERVVRRSRIPVLTVRASAQV